MRARRPVAVSAEGGAGTGRCGSLQRGRREKPTPYGQLILAILAGDTRLSAHAAEAEEGWRIVAPILAAWGEGRSPLAEYPAGSDGLVPSVIPEPRVDLRATPATQGAAADA